MKSKRGKSYKRYSSKKGKAPIAKKVSGRTVESEKLLSPEKEVETEPAQREEKNVETQEVGGGRGDEQIREESRPNEQGQQNEPTAKHEEHPAHEPGIEEKLKGEIAQEKDRYLRLAAEFDNYRRRMAKEILELTGIASEGVIKDLLPIVDDFERALKILGDEGTPEQASGESAKEGINLIYKKLCDMLKSKGVTEIEAMGLELNTDEHEAVAQVPAQEDKMKGKIVDVIQKGYKLNGKVIRFAKVVVGS